VAGLAGGLVKVGGKLWLTISQNEDRQTARVAAGEKDEVDYLKSLMLNETPRS
jgi:hypothetical protein